MPDRSRSPKRRFSFPVVGSELPIPIDLDPAPATDALRLEVEGLWTRLRDLELNVTCIGRDVWDLLLLAERLQRRRGGRALAAPPGRSR